MYNNTGVIKNIPANSHFHFDFATSLDNSFLGSDKDANWDWYEFYTYVKVKPQTNIADFTRKIQTLKLILQGKIFIIRNP